MDNALSVDKRLMRLEQKRLGAVLQTLDVVELPQRTVELESSGHQASDQLVQLGPAAGLGEGVALTLD